MYMYKCIHTHVSKHKGTCHEHLANYGFLAYFTKVTKEGLTLSMKTLAPKEIICLK